MAQFPPSGVKEDSKYFMIDLEDKTIKSETDGGYVYTRPRHARPPRRMISTGFTFLNESQHQKIQNFIVAKGTHSIFNYKVPTTGEVIDVRFDKMPKAKYVGRGGVHRYDYGNVVLSEV